MKTGMMLSLCLALVSARTASADCVDAEDLWTGVEVEYDDGLTHRFHRINDEIVQLVIEGSAFTITTDLVHGFYMVRSRISGGRSVINSRTYYVAHADLHVPDGADVWIYETTHWAPPTGSNMPIPVEELSEYQAFEPDKLRIDDCSYTYIPVHLRTTRGPSVTENRLGYIPSAGILLALGQVREDLAISRTPVSIRAVE